MTKKEIWQMFADKKIYLNNHYLDQAFDTITNAKSVFAGIYQAEAIYSKMPQFKGVNGKIFSAYKLDEYNGQMKYLAKVRKPINQIDIETGKVIATHASIYDAAEALGKNRGFSNISNAANGVVKTAYRFKWSFVND